MTGIADMEAPRPCEERHWFVAIADTDVGPLDISEIEARWCDGEIDETTIVWRPGMLDWQVIANIPELGYLISEMPHDRQPQLPEIRWVTTDAVSLSALVARELEGDSAPTLDEPKKPLFSNDGGLPDLGAVGFQTQHWDDGWGLPGPNPVTAAPIGVPWPVPEEDRSKRLLMGALIGSGFLLLTIGLVLAITELIYAPSFTQPTATIAMKTIAPLSEEEEPLFDV
ncbi:DUF4339 domain-containing protein, partial [Myxococcota bacterium]